MCGNARTVRQDWIEGAVLDALSERFFTPEMVDAILEEIATSASADPEGTGLPVKEVRTAIRQAEKEIENLRLAIRTGGPIEELVEDLWSGKDRKTRLDGEHLHGAGAGGIPGWRT